jgi:large subunit ribosomal protein L54
MICSPCRRAILQRLRTSQFPSMPSISTTSFRYASTVPSTPSAAPAAPPSIAIPGTGNEAQQSSSPAKSQPLSTPATLSSTTSSPAQTKPSTKSRSSVPGGKELRGLGYTKAKPKVLSMEDDEYPEWLWGLLDEMKPPSEAGEKVDFACTSTTLFSTDARLTRMIQP